MTVLPARAIATASSVFPVPGGPSIMSGFCIWSARKTTWRMTGSIINFAASKLRESSSTEENTTKPRGQNGRAGRREMTKVGKQNEASSHLGTQSTAGQACRAGAANYVKKILQN